MKNPFTSEPALPNDRTQRLQWFEYALYTLILLVVVSIPFYTDGFMHYGQKRII